MQQCSRADIRNFVKPVPRPASQMVFVKSTRYFTAVQIARVFTAALVIHNVAANFATALWMTVVFLMVSGSSAWTPPCAETIQKYETEFYDQMKGNLKKRWVADGVVRYKQVDGRQVPVLRQPPLLSVSFDISTTRTSTGLASISTRVSWLDCNWELQAVCLGIDAFQLQDPDEEEDAAVTTHTGRNIAKFVLALAQKLFLKDKLTREGRWNEKTSHMGMGLTGRTLGLVGVGCGFLAGCAGLQ
jgi:hypothetical protein